jgi:hypothetical protein
MKAYGFLFIACLTALACFCGTLQVTGGTSSSENARISGAAIDSAGAPVPGTSVFLIPAGFNPAEDRFDQKVAHDTTDGSGGYSFDNVSPDTYNIQARNPVSGMSFLVTGITVEKKDTVARLPDTLKNPGTVIVVLETVSDSASGKVYIPGTTIYRNVAANATAVTLDSIPSGTIPAILIKGTDQTSADILASNVRVVPSDTTILSFADTLYINTSPSGADVPSTLTHFPLLVRLDSTFNFERTRPDGGDIRFAKANGTSLAYEIAQWDTALKKAALWVSMDTVYGNSTSQFIIMSWGYLAAPGQSRSTAVFDTAYGFAGVWHLEEGVTATGATGAFKDATQNRAHGTNYISSVDRDGIAGNGRNFNGMDYILISKPFLSLVTQDFTMGFWVNLRRERGLVFSKDTAVAQDSCAKRLYFGDAAGDLSGLHPSMGGKASGAAVSGSVLTLNTWHHVAFTWEHTSRTAAFYVDGAKTAMAENSFVPLCADNPKNRVIFGYDGQYLFGFLDEIHIASAIRSDDWLKLSYENQRADQKFVSGVK